MQAHEWTQVYKRKQKLTVSLVSSSPGAFTFREKQRKKTSYIYIYIYMLVVDTVTQTHIVNTIQFIKYNNQYLVRLCGVAGLDCITTKAEWGDGG